MQRLKLVQPATPLGLVAYALIIGLMGCGVMFLSRLALGGLVSSSAIGTVLWSGLSFGLSIALAQVMLQSGTK